eukprot:m.13951 g.13951  ORF g.13951 m.13951 type:complete len:596 (+) comp3105_c0_seq1:220-2007(+)
MDLHAAIDALGDVAGAWLRVEAEAEAARASARATSATLDALRRRTHQLESANIDQSEDTVSAVSSDPEAYAAHREAEDERVHRIDDTIARAQAARQTLSASTHRSTEKRTGIKSRDMGSSKGHARSTSSTGTGSASSQRRHDKPTRTAESSNSTHTGARQGTQGGRHHGRSDVRSDRDARNMPPTKPLSSRRNDRGKPSVVVQGVPQRGRMDSSRSSGSARTTAGRGQGPGSASSATTRPGSSTTHLPLLPTAGRRVSGTDKNSKDDKARPKSGDPADSRHHRPPPAAMARSKHAHQRSNDEGDETHDDGPSFSPRLTTLMKQHQGLMGKALAASRVGKGVDAWHSYSARVTHTMDLSAARTTLAEAYNRIAALMKCVTPEDMDTTAQHPPTREALVPLCRLATLHDVVAMADDCLHAVDVEVAACARAEHAARESLSRHQAACDARLSAFASSRQARAATQSGDGGPTDTTRHADVWLPVDVVSTGAARHTAMVVSCITALADSDVSYSTVHELVAAAEATHRLQTAILELELEHRLTVILAALATQGAGAAVSGGQAGRGMGSDKDTERLFAEVYRTVCMLRGDAVPTFVKDA